MAENNLQDNVNVNPETTPELNGKKIRAGYIFLALVPFAVIMVLQTVAVLPGMILSVFEFSKNNHDFDLPALMKLFNEKYAVFSYIGYCVVALAVFLPWYIKGFVKKDPKVSYKKALGLKPVILTLALMVGLFFLVNGAFVVADKLFPAAMKKYGELMELSSLGSNMWLTVLYGILLGPVAEELCYRGLMFRLLEKSNIKIVFVILIQAAFFGIMHSNLVQGIYAFALGVLFGYLRYKYKTIILTTGAHMLFNFSGTIVTIKLEDAGMTDALNMILGAAGVVLVAVFIILIVKDKRSCYEQEIPA